jgi:hypothetical protein
MAELMTLVCITCGLPVAVLFAAGYLLQHRHSRVEAMFGLSEAVVPISYAGPSSAHEHAAGVRCWEITQCALAKRDKCPAYDRTYLPCWLARKLANGGRLEHACLECALYQPERVVEGVAPAAESAAETR